VSLKVVMAALLALSFCCHEEVMVVSFCVVGVAGGGRFAKDPLMDAQAMGGG